MPRLPHLPESLPGVHAESLDDLWTSQYLHHLGSERRLSPHTLSAVERDLKLLPPGFIRIQPDDLKRVMVQRHAQDAAPSSLARLASSWRGFFAWLHQEGLIGLNPSLRLKVPKVNKPLPKALQAEQIQGLLHGDYPEDFRWARAHTLIELLYGTGLRISEALGLCLSDKVEQESSLSWLSLTRRELLVVGKGSKARMIPLVPAVVDVIRRWLPLRQARLLAMGIPDLGAPLFIGARSPQFSARQAQKDLADYAVLKGVDRHLHPHMLRHSFGSHVLQESQDLRAVQELLGHSSIKSTQVYTSLDFKHLAQVYDQAFPRAKKSDTH